MVSFEDVKNNTDIQAYIIKADESLAAIGYTEHHFAHVMKVASVSGEILRKLGYPEREAELAMIAGYMHDIGNLVNRVDHSQSGAVMCFRILDKMGMDAEEIATVVTAVGNHDEGTGVAVNEVAAALIIADKTDVRRSRVRSGESVTFDIHDRVNYAVTDSEICIDTDSRELTLKLTIDGKYCSVADYFEIFLERMLMCRRAAEKLALRFGLSINGQIMM